MSNAYYDNTITHACQTKVQMPIQYNKARHNTNDGK